MPDLAYREVYAMNPREASKRRVQTYRETGSIRQTASLWHTSRQVVRTWVQREAEQGEEGLQDRSRRPHRSPRQTAPETEDLVVQARQETGYGRLRLAWYLRQRYGVHLSPHTLRHILRRHGLTDPQRRRKPLYATGGPSARGALACASWPTAITRARPTASPSRRIGGRSWAATTLHPSKPWSSGSCAPWTASYAVTPRGASRTTAGWSGAIAPTPRSSIAPTS